MVTTVREVVNKVLRDFLEPADSQPTRITLNGAILAADTSLIFDPTYMSPEEDELLGPGVLIQVDSELMLVGDIDDVTNTISGLTRGVNGTTAADHDDGALIEISPLWSRQSVFEAVGDSIVELWPDLFGVSDSTEVTLSRTGWSEVPDYVEDVIYLWAGSGTSWAESGFNFLANFGPSSTGKAISTPSYYGSTGWATFKVRPLRPTDEDDTLASLFVDESWVKLICVSTVAYLITSRDIDEITEEHIDAQMTERQPNIASSLRDRLLGYHDYLLQRAKRVQRFQYPTRQVQF